MEDEELEEWRPRTRLGRKVKEGEITSLSEVFQVGERPREVEIIDFLVPDMEEEILGVNMVQRMHKSGRRIKFRVTTVVGNEDGIVGVAHASGGEVGPSIRKSIVNAKLNVIEIPRGCGSWECNCELPHSIPFEANGHKGSIKITLEPAPRGLGLAAAEIPAVILRMAGIKDVWTRTEGKTRTTINFGLATFDALKKMSEMEVSGPYADRIVVGEAGEKVV